MPSQHPKYPKRHIYSYAPYCTYLWPPRYSWEVLSWHASRDELMGPHQTSICSCASQLYNHHMYISILVILYSTSSTHMGPYEHLINASVHLLICISILVILYSTSSTHMGPYEHLINASVHLLISISILFMQYSTSSTHMVNLGSSGGPQLMDPLDGPVDLLRGWCQKGLFYTA